ncbi:AraC family transcriptional regulator [Microvirga vignae]|uniref:AraC family transcriptional regulator n=1 Tax=Microvirga vignae TaxID=1225564 RepID=A0A0H1R9V5_9HYPH|nr:GlxA family transcriptional regulator [Microvirga vignae]KLK91656.1 AraC family transcriptional regulator [Microvirga vignae]
MRRVAILAFPGAQLLDVVGPTDVFAEANRQAKELHYRIEVVSSGTGPLQGSSGLRILPDRSIHDPVLPVDTLLIAGDPTIHKRPVEEEVQAWVKATAALSRRFGSVCSGAFVLAEAGLLKGRSATTHWSQAGTFARRYPDVLLDANRIFTADGPVWTSAGVTAGIDLALALVEEDLGREVAMAVARELVVFLKRPGGQAQFSAHLAAQEASRTPVQAAQAYILDNLAADLSVPTLAKRVGMSERHFARVFRQDAGVTPAEFVETARLDAARRLVEDPSMPLQRIATRTGFGDMVTMRRAFMRQLHVSPLAYRNSFAGTGAHAMESTHAKL